MEIKSIYSVLNINLKTNLNTMQLESGITYTVLKTDGSKIKFTFSGNLATGNEVYGIVDGRHVPLTEIFSGGYYAYWINQ